MSTINRLEIIHLYGRLLRVQYKAFARDNQLILAARKKTREEFEFAKTLSNEPLKEKWKMGNEVCQLLERNIIQAELLKDDPRPYYRLNFRQGIEINDGHMKGKIGKCC